MVPVLSVIIACLGHSNILSVLSDQTTPEASLPLSLVVEDLQKETPKGSLPLWKETPKGSLPLWSSDHNYLPNLLKSAVNGMNSAVGFSVNTPLYVYGFIGPDGNPGIPP